MNKSDNILNFKVFISQDEDGIFVASCTAIPGCHSQGKTYEEVINNIKEAIELCLKVAQDDIEYRESIDFSNKITPRFIGISEVKINHPSFV